MQTGIIKFILEMNRRLLLVRVVDKVKSRHHITSTILHSYFILNYKHYTLNSSVYVVFKVYSILMENTDLLLYSTKSDIISHVFLLDTR